MSYPILKPSNTWFIPNVSTINRGTITVINIVDSYTPTTTPTDSWDASISQDGSITVYVEGTVLTISGNGSGSIIANEDASGMFAGFSAAIEINGLNLLDTSNTINMASMFENSKSLTYLDVSSFNMSKVENMTSMFAGSDKNNLMQLIHIEFGDNFDTSNVKTMERAFQYCAYIETIDAAKLDVSFCESLRAIFNYCYVLKNVDVSNWNLQSCKTLQAVFNYCHALEYVDVSNWNTGTVENFRAMFQECYTLKNLNISNWNTSSCTDMGYMFYGCKALKSLRFEDWDVRKVKDFNHFMAHAYIEDFDVSKWIVTSECTNLNGMFHTAMVKYLDVSGFDTSNVTRMNQMFENTERVEEIKGLENFNTSKVISFQDMFNNAFAIKKLNLSSFDARNILYVANMFNRVQLDEFSIGDNYVFTGDQNYQSHFFPNSTTGYWYSLYGEEYLPDEVPRGKAMSYYSTVESAKAALIELNGKKYVNLNSLSMFHDLQNVEIDTKINTLREELGNIEEISSEDIQALFSVSV